MVKHGSNSLATKSQPSLSKLFKERSLVKKIISINFRKNGTRDINQRVTVTSSDGKHGLLAYKASSFPLILWMIYTHAEPLRPWYQTCQNERCQGHPRSLNCILLPGYYYLDYFTFCRHYVCLVHFVVVTARNYVDWFANLLNNILQNKEINAANYRPWI